MTDAGGQSIADIPAREQRCLVAVTIALDWIVAYQGGHEPRGLLINRLESLLRSAKDGPLPPEILADYSRDHE